jgi:hypothetical protein
MLEIGVGGYDSPISGGESLRMWKRIFLLLKFCIRYFDKSFLEEKDQNF